MFAQNVEELILSISNQKSVDKTLYPRRVYDLLCMQGFDPHKICFIHVTGSKGKGSLARTAFDLLVTKGVKTGLFISPHIHDIRERFETSDGLISHEKLGCIFNQYYDLLKKQKLCFFEICLFLALVYFLEQSCDYVVLEVGIGGRFDPTNFCFPTLVLIGHISLEHQNILGSTIEDIAYEKAGVIKKGSMVFSVDQEEKVANILRGEGEVTFFHDCFTISNKIFTDKGVTFDLEIGSKKISFINLIRLGEAHLINFCLAAGAVYSLDIGINESMIREVAKKNIPYRMDYREEGLLVDVAHTDTSFQNLMECLDKQIQWRDIILYIGFLQGKDFFEIFEILKKFHHILQKIVFFDFSLTNSIRESNGKYLYDTFKSDLIITEYLENISLLQHDPNSKKVLAGSFYSVSLFMKQWENR